MYHKKSQIKENKNEKIFYWSQFLFTGCKNQAYVSSRRGTEEFKKK